jgi:hypothetical protein
MPYKRTGRQPGRPRKPPIRDWSSLSKKQQAVALLDHNLKGQGKNYSAERLSQQLYRYLGFNMSARMIRKLRNSPIYKEAYGPGAEIAAEVIYRQMLVDGIRQRVSKNRN